MTRSVRLSSLGLMVLLAGALAFVACARVEARNPTAIPPTSTPEPENTPTPTFTPSPTPSPTPPSPTPSPEASPFPTATPSPTPLPVSNNGRSDLFLDLQGIGDENVIQGNIIIIRGQTSPAAILSINALIVQVDANGNFEAEIRLNPGANVIEVVASDLDGNQINRVVAVVSLPEDEADTGGGA